MSNKLESTKYLRKKRMEKIEEALLEMHQEVNSDNTLINYSAGFLAGFRSAIAIMLKNGYEKVENIEELKEKAWKYDDLCK